MSGTGAGAGIGRQRIATASILSYLMPKALIFFITIGSLVASYMILINVIFNFHTQINIDPVVLRPKNLRHSVATRRPFHVAMTASDGEYNKWQCRIAYYWYKKVRDLPGSEMGGFTRILHSGQSDELMNEIPTFVVNPLPPGQDQVINQSFSSSKATISYSQALLDADNFWVISVAGVCCVEQTLGICTMVAGGQN